MKQLDLEMDKLLELLNGALVRVRQGSGRTCRVELLRPATCRESNWEVDTLSFSGPDLLHMAECENRVKSVVRTFTRTHTVAWPCGA